MLGWREFLTIMLCVAQIPNQVPALASEVHRSSPHFIKPKASIFTSTVVFLFTVYKMISPCPQGFYCGVKETVFQQN